MFEIRSLEIVFLNLECFDFEKKKEPELEAFPLFSNTDTLRQATLSK